jgi:heterodisulfide reductase subunit D
MGLFDKVDVVNLREWARRVIDERAYRCIRCGTCRTLLHTQIKGLDFKESCPSGAYMKADCYYAFGKLFAMQGLLEGVISWDARLIDMIYKDPLCGMCQENCTYINGVIEVEGGEPYIKAYPAPYEVLEAARVLAVEDGAGPHPTQKLFSEGITKNHNPYLEPHERRFDWLRLVNVPLVLPSEAEIIYFTGCTASYRLREVAISTVKIFSKLGLKFAVLGGDEWCCGSPLLRTGQYRAAIRTLSHVVESINRCPAKVVVTSCAGCYRVLSRDVERLGLTLRPEVKHTASLIYENLDKLMPSFKKLDMKVTYHDPCHIGRHLYPRQSIYEEPREVLSKIPGVEFVEMKRIKNYSWCCGSGAGAKAAFPDMAIWAASERIREASAVRSSCLVSTCPFCDLNFLDAVRERGLKMKVLDLTQLVVEALGV